jgi:hypothetical protein
MALQGTRTTQTGVTESRIVRVPDEDMLMLEPNEAPLVTFMLGMKKKKVIESPRIEHFDDDYIDRWVTSSDLVAANAASTTLTLTDGSGIVPGDLLLVPQLGSTAPEQIRVTAKPGANVCTVVRNIGSTGLVAIASGAALVVLGQAFEEGAATPTAKTTSPVQRLGYCQIFRKSIDITRTQASTKNYADGGDERKRLREKMMREFKIAKNRQYLWGVPSESMSGGPSGAPIRTTGGINHYISTNRYDANGLLTQKGFETFSRQAFRYGSEKILLASPVVISAIHQWGNSYLKINPGEKMFGVNIEKVTCGNGVFILLKDWMLEDGVAGQPGFSGYAFSLDMDKITERVLKGADTKMTLNNQTPGTDKFVDEVLSECGLQVRHEKRHAVMYGVSDYAA